MLLFDARGHSSKLHPMADSSKRRSLVLCLGVVAALAVLAVGYLKWSPFLPRFGGRSPLPGGKNSIVGRVDISSGSIEVNEFARLLGDITELPVIVDSDTAQEMIHLTVPMKGVDSEIVRALLQANGYEVEVEELPNGREILRIRRKPKP